MKKIIAGRLYDTETATKIADYHSSYPYNDFGYYEESLYRKKTGEFFLYGEGGPASKYAKSVGQNEWRGSEKIIPISYENAQKWAERAAMPASLADSISRKRNAYQGRRL